MVPKIAAKGASFKGAAAYYLHDKGKDTDERVEWTETRNLATDDPDLAWRIMAATASCQSRLKEQAGIPPTGRKSVNVVMTYSVAWHPNEKKTLTREEMLQAAVDSIQALGAGEHQALLVCHNDEPHPHVHIMLNRVSPIDGRMLSSSKEKLKLSRWAQDYEERRGKIWCEERVKNNHAREVLGKFTRAAKEKPRHIFEIEAKAKATTRRRPAEAKALSDAERQRDAALSKKGREMAERHDRQWKQLSKVHRARKRAIAKGLRRAIVESEDKIKAKNAPAREAMEKRHSAEKRLFDRREQRLAGRMQNIVDAVRSTASVRDKDKGRIGEAFNVITSRAKREEQFRRVHARESRTFNAKENKQLAKAEMRLKEQGKEKQQANLERFYEARKSIQFTQGMESAKLKAEWKQRNGDRKKVWKEFRLGQFIKKHGVGGGGGINRDQEHYRERER